MIDQTYTHETKSIYELATLLALGAEVKKVDRPIDDKFCTFYLESKTVDLKAKVLELASKTLVINAYDLLNAYTRAKSIVHSR